MANPTLLNALVALHLANAVTSVAQTETVIVQLQDGQQPQADVLVAADGAGATCASNCYTTAKPQPTGHLAYRTMVKQVTCPKSCKPSRSPPGLGRVCMWCSTRCAVVTSDERGGHRARQVPGRHRRSWDHSANAADLQRIVADSCAPLRDLIHAIEAWRRGGR